MSKKEMPKTTDAKLEEVVLHLRRMDKRDRMRMWGSLIKGMISVVPMILFLWGSWYLYQNGDAVLQKIAAEAARQAAEVTEKSASGILEQFQNLRSQ